MAWSKAGSTTLTSAGDTITISSMTASNFYTALSHNYGTGGTVYNSNRINANSGSNYAWRRSINGGTDSTFASQAQIAHDSGNINSSTSFCVGYLVGIETEEKLAIFFEVGQSTAGAGNAPNRVEAVGKYADTSNTIDQLSDYNVGAGNYDTGSNISALGSDGVESMTVQDGAVYYETDTNKEYVLYDNTWTEL